MSPFQEMMIVRGTLVRVSYWPTPAGLRLKIETRPSFLLSLLQGAKSWCHATNMELLCSECDASLMDGHILIEASCPDKHKLIQRVAFLGYELNLAAQHEEDQVMTAGALVLNPPCTLEGDSR